MSKRCAVVAAALVFVATVGVSRAEARDHISIVGSSTVYPFATVVAEQFGRSTSFKTPAIEATGSGGGLKLFCGGVGVQYPDITNSSRRIKATEVKSCTDNGVKAIVEVKIGYDGIVLASSKKATRLKLTRKELYLAMAKEVPNPKGGEKVVANPYKTWRDVNPALPANAIEVLGPPPTSGTRDAFIELVMEDGAREFPWLKAMEKSDPKRFKLIADSMREDGAFVEAGENDNLIVQKLEVNPKALGIFGFSYLEQNSDKLQGAMIEGEPPTFEAIAAGKYPVSRPLYIYVKKAHAGMIPGIKEFLNEFTSDKAWGEDGYLADKGLIPMPKAERAQFQLDARDLRNLSLK